MIVLWSLFITIIIILIIVFSTCSIIILRDQLWSEGNSSQDESDDPYSIEHPEENYPRELNEEDVDAVFEIAYNHHDRGRFEDALDNWYILYRTELDMETWGKVINNIGIEYFCLQKYNESMYYFIELLDSNVDDSESGECLMETNRNYHNRACIMIANCYECTENYTMTLHYLELARDIYPYISWCGTCAESSWNSLDNRIERIEEIISLLENGTVYSNLRFFIDIENVYNDSFTFLIPIPIYYDENDLTIPSFEIEDISITNGTPFLSYEMTEYGISLNITSNSSCSFGVNITFENESYIDIFDGFSMTSENYSYYNWIYSDIDYYSINVIRFHGKWFSTPPNYDYWIWKDYHEPDCGWNESYIF